MKKLVIALISAIICSSLANADERTYEAQAALKALGYRGKLIAVVSVAVCAAAYGLDLNHAALCGS